jgi:2-methylcitrate dehydratase PrpD
LGLAATQAAGLVASFGTMGKHLNAAKAAVDGLLAARLAEHEFTGATEALESDNGYLVAHTCGGNFDPQRPRQVMGDRLAVDEIFFKRHACCHVTHSAIEGERKLRREHEFSNDDIDRVLLKAAAGALNAVGIREPATGLEAKFSIFYASTLALSGSDTGPAGSSDERV